MKKYLLESWYQTHSLRWLLSPLSTLFRIATTLLQLCYKSEIFKRYSIPIPVIIIGNINIGGTGKTPLVIWLARQLQRYGFKPGIISRGYGSMPKRYPLLVSKDSDPADVGDEPVIIARHIDCPIAISPKRIKASTALIKHFNCNLIISDDGLQHYAFNRNIEIVVVDAERTFGNEYCLPSGPLREPISRLKYIDFLVYNGEYSNYLFDITISAVKAINLTDTSIQKGLVDFSGQDAHGIAGIGNPKRFFNLLNELGINVIPHEFNDHHYFQSTDINFDDDKMVLMTEKDAVKCQYFASYNMWYVPIKAAVSGKLNQRIIQKLAGNNTNG
ncbi:MAG: tetraacyldisaccharide 4'-kinase [Piscirickettsiaceae bacterium]|nr:tetraacyldisaccharide 4'-kinase [Piscirickettsiaceae bacterium]